MAACRSCGADFAPAGPRARYCSAACRLAARRASARESERRRKGAAVVASPPSRGRGPNVLAARRFGKLTVLERADGRQHTNARWLCRCDCGREVALPTGHLTRRERPVRSCGGRDCSGRTPDLLGREGGPWRVVARAGSTPRHAALWLLRCLACGAERSALGTTIRRGAWPRCGCGAKAPPDA